MVDGLHEMTQDVEFVEDQDRVRRPALDHRHLGRPHIDRIDRDRMVFRDQPLIGRLVGVHRSFPSCDGARQRFRPVAAPFADTFLLGDVPVASVVSSPVSPDVPPARLRGGASDEAKGRRGARGGGAGRVRAPAGCRLCVLRHIGDQLVAGLEQFLFVDDVVAVEDGAGLVAGQEHGNALGDAGADQVAGGGAAAIVEEASRHAGRLTGGAPRRAPAADGDAVAVEDERAVDSIRSRG